MAATARRMDVDEFWRWIDLATLDLAVLGRALLAAARAQCKAEQEEARKRARAARIAAWRCAKCGRKATAAQRPLPYGAWPLYCGPKCRRAAKAERRQARERR